MTLVQTQGDLNVLGLREFAVIHRSPAIDRVVPLEHQRIHKQAPGSAQIRFQDDHPAYYLPAESAGSCDERGLLGTSDRCSIRTLTNLAGLESGHVMSNVLSFWQCEPRQSQKRPIMGHRFIVLFLAYFHWPCIRASTRQP